MAVFHRAEALAIRAETVLRKNTEVIKLIFAVITAILNLMSTLDNFLTKFGRMISKAAGSIKDASDAIGRMPFFQGPWKVVAKIITTLLSKVAGMLEAAGKAIEKLGKAVRGNKKKKLDEKLLEMQIALATLRTASDDFTHFILMVKTIAAKLKEQQDDFEKLIPGLKPTVMPLLDKIDTALTMIEELQHKIEEKIKPLQDALKEVEDLIASMNPLEKLLSTLQKPLDFISDTLKKFQDAIKEFLKWLGLDKLFDSIEEGVKWLMKHLGIDAALNWAAEQVRKLPLISKIVELKDKVIALIDKLLADVQAALDNVQKAITECDLAKTISEAIKDIFARLGLNKVDVESYLPGLAGDLLEKTRDLRNRLNPERAEEDADFRKALQNAWKEMEKLLAQLLEQLSIKPLSTFAAKEIQLVAGHVAIALEHQQTQADWDGIDNTMLEPVLLDIEGELVASVGVFAGFHDSVNMQPRGYYAELATTLQELMVEWPQLTVLEQLKAADERSLEQSLPDH